MKKDMNKQMETVKNVSSYIHDFFYYYLNFMHSGNIFYENKYEQAGGELSPAMHSLS